MKNEAHLVPNPATPNRPVLFDSNLCNGCNSCVEVCRMGVLMPHPEKGKPPIVVYPDECWYCGCCVEHCLRKANRLEHPLNQRMAWKRKLTGEYFRVGIGNPRIFDMAPERSETGHGRKREWPYPVQYGKENEVEADVLIIGGGMAGCHAAINAAKQGASVVVVDKGPVIRSGSAGAGIDHWLKACTNPCSKVSPEELTEAQTKGDVPGEEGEYIMAHSYYIEAKESYGALLDVQAMGLEFRDVDDEFAGAEFRDERTKIMFAYDYESKCDIRLRGGKNLKPILYKELKRLGIRIEDRIMTTSLLTEGGRQGGRVVGATGVHARTGEFYVFKAKATVLCCGQPQGLWIFSTELTGSAARFMDPNNVGDGYAMGWNAGAIFTMMERSELHAGTGGFTYPAYGTGAAHNTYFACSLVDDNGKAVPWVNRDGKILETVSERYRPATGQKFFMGNNLTYKVGCPRIIPDLPERIRKGEFVLPLYADLPGMPELDEKPYLAS